MSEHIIKVWDLPTRLFHWSLAMLVVAAVVTVKIGGNAMLWHGRIGLAIVGLVVFRIAWGVVGSTYARFTDFVPGPRAIRDYLAGRWDGVGHNPLGALSVLALLGVVAFQVGTGLFSNDDIAFNGPLVPAVSSDTSGWLSGLHRQGEWFLYGLVVLHVAAVLYYVRARRDDILTPMITGRKRVEGEHREARGGGVAAFVIALTVALGAVWAASGALLPPPPPPPPANMGW
ncbi:MAG: cytochrome b/b6 domain-containing protein [Pseudazoarcus pumilus]|nr:cytochrome b/b6 domain-containing protein [Pseudazoarcus pumilus]